MTLTLTRQSAVRHRGLILGVVAGLVVAIGYALLLGFQGHSSPSWQQLPTPGSRLSPAGATIGSGGGLGDGKVHVDTAVPSGQFSIDVSCRGDGTIAFKVGGTPMGTVQCFPGQVAGYRLTKVLTVADVQVSVGSKVAWKVIASVGSGG